MKKILLSILAASSVSSFAGILPDVKTTKAFDEFVNQVSNDVTAINNKQVAENQAYKQFNYDLVISAKGKGQGLGVKFINAAQVKAYPHLIAANKAIMNINANANLDQINQSLALAKSEINQYQAARQALFNDQGIQSDGYFIVNREANAFLCSLQSAENAKTGGLKIANFLVNAKKYADCIVAHEANKDKDLTEKARVYATTITAPSEVANTFIANANYFTSDQFIARVNAFATQQKSDVKKILDQNINAKTCNASMDSFRAAFDKVSQTNTSLKMLSLASQPKSTVRTAIDLFANAEQGKLISDALDISYVNITGNQVKDTSKKYDVCDYATYQKNKANNVYLNKLINFNDVAKRTNGMLSAEQVYQLSVIAGAQSQEYVISDKSSGANKLFN